MSSDIICESYSMQNSTISHGIGYSKNSEILFIVIPSLSITANLFGIIRYLKKKFDQKRNQ